LEKKASPALGKGFDWNDKKWSEVTRHTLTAREKEAKGKSRTCGLNTKATCKGPPVKEEIGGE